MSNKPTPIVATMGIDIGKNSFHVIGLDRRGAIVLRQKGSRTRIEARVANMPRRAGQDHGLGPLRAVEARPLEQYY
jgi:hypothetical protein